VWNRHGPAGVCYTNVMKPGDLIDEFELQDQDGKPVTLSDLVVDGPAVLYFYIKAMTPG